MSFPGVYDDALQESFAIGNRPFPSLHLVLRFL